MAPKRKNGVAKAPRAQHGPARAPVSTGPPKDAAAANPKAAAPSKVATPARTAAPSRAAHFAEGLVVDVPPPPHQDVEVALLRRTSVEVHDDDDVENAARQGWISGPCDCCLTIWAGLGEAIEGGAEQIVGLLLLPLSGLIYYYFAVREGRLFSTAAATPPGMRAPPAPPAHPDWSGLVVQASADYAQLHPLWYVAFDLGGLLVVGLLVLFEADLHRLYRDCRLRARGYDVLESRTDGAASSEAADADSGRPVRMMREATLRRELHKAIDATEELDLEMRVRAVAEGTAAAEGAATDAIGQKLQAQRERLGTLQAALSRNVSFAASPEHRSGRLRRTGASCCARVLSSTLVTVFRRALNGLVTVWLYFADVISDVEVTLLLHAAGKTAFAAVAAFLLVLQFLAVWLRVLPYLRTTFGPDALISRFFLYLGFPFGMVGLDCLMFLEPFGLLPVVPLGERMRQFIPAYKATRIMAEVLIESLPQCLLQSYILVTVMHHVHSAAASRSELLLLDASIDGSTFAQILPRSIAISTITTLKAWIELVHSAREAGISVRTKTVQLLNVGFGLPLEALKKGTITEWSCTYHLADGEVSPLLDALIKNSSLTRLHLAAAGLDWSGPEASKERSGAALVEAMAASGSVLAELQHLVVSSASGFEMPVARLRQGGAEALEALRRRRLLRNGGPWRTDLLLMGDLLRKNARRTSVAAQDVEASAQAALSLVERAHRGEVSSEVWESALTQMIADGNVRRSHLKTLVGAPLLRCVGFSAKALLAVQYSASELKEGGFSARQLREAGFAPAALHGMGYGASELKGAGLGALELRDFHFTATELRAAAFSAVQLRAARYTLPELKAAGYPLAELKTEADYKASELRAAQYGADELRKAKVFTTSEMREAGYPAAELKAVGVELKRMCAAGYEAAEVTAAGWSLEQLKSAGYDAKALRRAGHAAVAMRAVGFDLDSLRWAGYPTAALQEAGFDAATLKEGGVGLFQLRQANTPIATLKQAGYKADRLKLQGYTVAELAADGVYTAKELRGFRDSLYHEDATKYGSEYAGYTAKELHDAEPLIYTAHDLKAGGFSEAELREGGYTAAELRAKGGAAKDLKHGGYTCKELHTGGYAVAELKAIGHTAAEMRAAGLREAVLRQLGYSVAELRAAGSQAAELLAASCTTAELKQGGFAATELLAVGTGIGELRTIGFEAAELHAAGCTAHELSRHGFGASELTAGGFASRVVEAVGGAPVDALRTVGNYAAGELRAAGYGVAELRAGGYTCKELKAAGYAATDLLGGGFRPRTVEAVDGRAARELRSKGFGAKELRGVGFSTEELVQAGFAAKELRDTGSSCPELRAAGATAKELKEAGYASKQLHAAGFTLRELREGGFVWKDLVIFLRATHAQLVDAGYEGLDPKDRIFKEYRPE